MCLIFFFSLQNGRAKKVRILGMRVQMNPPPHHNKWYTKVTSIIFFIEDLEHKHTCGGFWLALFVSFGCCGW